MPQYHHHIDLHFPRIVQLPFFQYASKNFAVNFVLAVKVRLIQQRKLYDNREFLHHLSVNIKHMSISASILTSRILSEELYVIFRIGNGLTCRSRRAVLIIPDILLRNVQYFHNHTSTHPCLSNQTWKLLWERGSGEAESKLFLDLQH